MKPAMAPNMPVQTTTAAVREGIPPNDEVISMAIGVVTDLEAREIATSFVAPSRCAIETTEMIPVMQPTSCERIIAVICCFICLRRRYRGRPRETMAGFNQNEMNWALSW